MTFFHVIFDVIFNMIDCSVGAPLCLYVASQVSCAELVVVFDRRGTTSHSVWAF